MKACLLFGASVAIATDHSTITAKAIDTTKSTTTNTPTATEAFACPEGSYVKPGARWPLVDIDDCRCAWDHKRDGAACVPKDAAHVSFTDADAAASTAHTSAEGYEATDFEVQSETQLENGGGGASVFKCPAHSHLHSRRWPIVDATDCRCNWGFTKSMGDGGVHADWATATCHGDLEARADPTTEPTGTAAAAAASADAAALKPHVFRCPPNSHIASLRFPLQDMRDCGCNAGYAFVAEGLAADDDTAGKCEKITTAAAVAEPAATAAKPAATAAATVQEKPEKKTFTCPDNAYIASMHWPLTSFERDCACAWGFVRTDTNECVQPTRAEAFAAAAKAKEAARAAVKKIAAEEAKASASALATLSFGTSEATEAKATEADATAAADDILPVATFEARLGGGETVESFMSKSKSFKKTVAASLNGVAETQVVITEVEPVVVVESAAGGVSAFQCPARSHVTTSHWPLAWADCGCDFGWIKATHGQECISSAGLTNQQIFDAWTKDHHHANAKKKTATTTMGRRLGAADGQLVVAGVTVSFAIFGADPAKAHAQIADTLDAPVFVTANENTIFAVDDAESPPSNTDDTVAASNHGGRLTDTVVVAAAGIAVVAIAAAIHVRRRRNPAAGRRTSLIEADALEQMEAGSVGAGTAASEAPPAVTQGRNHLFSHDLSSAPALDII